MNEIKKCPFCGMNAYAEISVNDGYVKALVMCKGCGVRYETVVPLNKYSHIGITIEYAFSVVLEQWNKRAEEPQEKKESNIEWALKKIEKGDFYFSICEIANYIKNGKPCAECDECEFQDDEDAINYLLAPHEKTDNEKN